MRNPNIILKRCDCMDLMRELPANSFDLAIVDPPYMDDLAEYSGMQQRLSGEAAKTEILADEIGGRPGPEYWDELRRISRFQIVWGVNHFGADHPGRIVWDKRNDDSLFNDCEIASQNVTNAVRLFRYRWNGMLQQNMKRKEVRVHPTQKPVDLYRWTLKQFAEPGWKIFDSHAGSFSIGIACHYEGFDLTACEISPEYYERAAERFRLETKQMRLL